MKSFFCAFLFFIFLSLNVIPQKINTVLNYSVNLPSKKTTKPPVLILLHGYGSNESDLLELSKTMDPTFITFSLRAPNVSGAGGFCWYEIEFLPDKQFKYSYSEALKSRAQILSFISNACKAYNLDSSSVFILGFSQGSIMAFDIALHAPGKVKGIVALSGRMMEESKIQKIVPAQLAKVKFFIAHGYSDNVIKVEESEKAYNFLKEKNVADLTLKKYEIPHSISGDELNDLRSWLSKAIKPVQKSVEQKRSVK